MEQIIAPPRPTETKLLSAPDIDKATLAKMGLELRSDIGAEDHPLVCITTPREDLAGDTNNTANIDIADFLKYLQVLDTHDSSKPPVALSTRPWLSGTSMLAIAKFPKPDVLENRNRIAAAVRAGLQRGASIGFIPLKDCRVIGSVSGATTSPPSDAKMADRRRQARALAAKGRSICAAMTDDPVPTREQRLAEAHNFRRTAMAATK